MRSDQSPQNSNESPLMRPDWEIEQMFSNMRRFCEKCGTKLDYVARGEFQCKNCGNKELNDYGKIREYIDEHGATPAFIIARDTGVDEAIIDGLLAIGKVEIPEHSDIFLACELCGEPIKYGRICPDCVRKRTEGYKDYLKDEIGEKPKQPPEKYKIVHHGKMHSRRRK